MKHFLRKKLCCISGLNTHLMNMKSDKGQGNIDIDRLQAIDQGKHTFCQPEHNRREFISLLKQNGIPPYYPFDRDSFHRDLETFLIKDLSKFDRQKIINDIALINDTYFFPAVCVSMLSFSSEDEAKVFNAPTYLKKTRSLKNWGTKNKNSISLFMQQPEQKNRILQISSIRRINTDETTLLPQDISYLKDPKKRNEYFNQHLSKSLINLSHLDFEVLIEDNRNLGDYGFEINSAVIASLWSTQKISGMLFMGYSSFGSFLNAPYLSFENSIDLQNLIKTIQAILDFHQRKASDA